MALGVLLLSSLVLLAPQPVECADEAACRQAALDAAAREDYEAFHDLAWRAVQRGRRNDPALMYLLARAQSLSGRPGDAVVMLRRLLGMGVVPDAREHDDFRNVRLLPAWPEVEALIAAASGSPLETVPLPAADGAAAAGDAPAIAATPAAPADVAATAPDEASPPAPATPGPTPAAAVPAARAAAPAALGGSAARRLRADAIDPAGLAYDSASRRFVLGDRRVNKVVVADEVFDQVNDLIGAAAGGFGTLTALAVDARRGDLWVTSGGADGASVHKLQLVSGRTLWSLEVPEAWQPAALTDLAVTDTGTLVLLDAAESRLLTVPANARAFDRVLSLALPRPSSVAVSGETAYVSHDAGLAHVDIASGRVTGVRAASGVTLSGLRRIRWHNGSLIGIQHLPGVGDRLVRLRLGRGSATSVEVLDDDPSAAGSVLTLSRDAAFYLTEDDGVQVIRRVPLQ